MNLSFIPSLNEFKEDLREYMTDEQIEELFNKINDNGLKGYRLELTVESNANIGPGEGFSLGELDLIVKDCEWRPYKWDPSIGSGTYRLLSRVIENIDSDELLRLMKEQALVPCRHIPGLSNIEIINGTISHTSNFYSDY